MRKLYLVGRIAKNDERGGILILMVPICLLLVVLFAGMAEFGRYLITREQLQTAADAGALAGAVSNVKRIVDVEVVTDRGDKVVCDENGCWCEDCGTVRQRVSGLERNLLDRGEWENYCKPPCNCGGGDCWYEIVDRKVVFDHASVGQTVNGMFAVNVPDQAEAAWVDTITVHDRQSDPYYPSVVVRAEATIRSLFARETQGLFMDRAIFSDTYRADVCAQGSTFHRDPRTQKGKHKGSLKGHGLWIKPPQDACRID